MKPELKRVNEQVIVITGASSGIGLATALMAARLGVEPTHMPPVYAPEVVAKAILASAERHQRNVLVGGGAKRSSPPWSASPLVSATGSRRLWRSRGQRSGDPVREPDTLFSPRQGDAKVQGHYRGHVMQSSAYTEARLRRRQALFGLAIAGAAVALLDRAGAFGDGA
jgi:hypothetical protein